VYQGDAYDRISDLPRSSVDCVITSPPYWGLRGYGLKHDDQVLSKWRLLVSKRPTMAASVGVVASGGLGSAIPRYAWYRDHGGQLGAEPYPDWYVAHLVEIFNKVTPVLADDGNLWVNLGDTYFARWSSVREGRQGLDNRDRTRRRTPSGGWLVDKQLIMIPARFAIAMQAQGWILRNDLIWSKPNPIPRPERDRLRLTHEHFFHFVRKPKSGRATYHYDLSFVEEGARDVVVVPSERNPDRHTATFPTQLVKPRIESSCPPGGLILDPFCGTGTSLEVAIDCGRRAIGFEKSKSFAAGARRRLRDAEARAPAPMVLLRPERS
jgi:DNA modification methylase